MTAPALTLTGSCPSCGSGLRVRTSRRIGELVVDCSDCVFTAPVLDALVEPLDELYEVLDTSRRQVLERGRLDKRLCDLIDRFDPDRHPALIPSERVVAELNALRAEVGL